ncbi:MAG: hypothetical protein WCJ01_08510 [Ignavibacteria bacterium]
MNLFDGTIKFNAFAEGQLEEMEIILKLYKREASDQAEYIALVSDLNRSTRKGSVIMNENQVYKTITEKFNIAKFTLIIFFPSLGENITKYDQQPADGTTEHADIPNQVEKYVFNKVNLNNMIYNPGTGKLLCRYSGALTKLLYYTEVEKLIQEKLFL